MEFSVLGSLSVRADDEELAIRGTKPRALLGLLLAQANRVVSADRLIEDLWEGNPPETAARTLHSHISALRRVIGHDRLQTRGRGYLLAVGANELDAACFEAEVSDAYHGLRGGDPSVAVGRLTKALDRWHGPALGEFATASWALAEASRLEEARVVAVETLLEARLALGEHTKAAAEAEAAVRVNPLRERLWAHLIVALYRQGRQADALRAYTRLRTTLADELGIDPSPELRDLERAVLAQDPSVGPPPAQAVRPTPGLASTQLPTGVVTFLLTDIAGSTRLWETASRAMTGALAIHDALIQGAVEAHGGVLLKAHGEGDSTFSVFRRATHAAAAALDAQGSLARADWPDGCRPSIRMALHTGEATERDGDYYGPTVNRAARLRAAAEPCQILVSRATADVIIDNLAPEADLVELGSQHLRDLARPETVYSLVRDADSAPSDQTTTSCTRIPFPSRLGPPVDAMFVGRDQELALLSCRLRQAADGQRRIVLIAGEPGVGKTALAAEAAQAAYAAGAIVLHGRCDEDLRMPYQPFAEAVEPLLEHLPTTVFDRVGRKRLGELARLVPTASGWSSTVNPTTTNDPETDRWLAFGALAAALSATAAEAPIVLVLDDLQWADKGTFLLLRHIAGASHSSRLVVVGTYRDGDVNSAHPLADFLVDLRRLSGVERLFLSGLGDLELISLMEASARHQLGDAGVAFARAVHRETDGNPFFSLEILRHLAESGAIRRDEQGGWVADSDPESIDLPQSVKDVVAQRVHHLGARAERVLRTAAVIGREFDLEVLSMAVQMSEEETLDVLEAAMGARVVEEVGGVVGRLGFAHELIQHTLVSQLSLIRRQKLHRLVAEALEDLCGEDPGARVTDLAHHWLEAGPSSVAVARASHFAIATANRALDALAYEAAASQCRRALGAFDGLYRPDLQARCELLLLVGDAEFRLGDLLEAKKTYLAAAEIAREREAGEQLARAALGVGASTEQMGIPQEAGVTDPALVRLLEEALDLVPVADRALRARVMGRLALALYYDADDKRRQSLARQAVETAGRVGDDAALIATLATLHMVSWSSETIEEWLAVATRMLALAECTGDRERAIQARGFRVMDLLALGDVSAAEREIEAYAALAQELHQPAYQAYALTFRAIQPILQGRWEDGEKLAQDAAATGQRVQLPQAMHLFSAQMWAIWWGRGQIEEIGDAVLDMLDETAMAYPTTRCSATLLLCLVGRYEEARDALADLAADDFACLPRRPDWLVGACHLAHVCAVLDDAGLARVLYRELSPHAGRVATGGPPAVVCFGLISHALGLLAVTADRPQQAERHFEQALNESSSMNARPFEAETCLEYGRLLFARGDRERSERLVRAAAAIARKLSMRRVTSEADVLLSKLRK